MKRRTRQNPIATAKDLGTLSIDDIGGGQAQVTIGGVSSPPYTVPSNVWSAVTGRDAGVKKSTGGIIPLEKFDPDSVGLNVALAAAVDECDATGGVVHLENDKTYFTTDPLTITDKAVRINFNGARIVRRAVSTSDDYTALTVVHSNSTPQAVVSVINNATFTPTWPSTLNVLSRTARIELASTAGWSVGDYVVVVSDDTIVGANPTRALQYEADRVRVAAITSTYLYTARPLRSSPVTNIRVARMTQKEVLLIDPWGEDEAGSPDARYLPIINIRGAVSPRVRNWQPRNLMSMGLKFEGCALGKVDGQNAYNLRTVPPNAYGYGIVLISCCDFTLRDIDGEFLRHAFTTGAGANMTANSPDMHRYGSTWALRVLGGAANDGGHAAFDFHEEAAYCVIDHCSVSWNHREPDGTPAGFQLRGRYTTVMNSSSAGPGGINMYAYPGGGFFKVQNYFHDLIPGIYGTSAYGISIGSDTAYVSGRMQAELSNVGIRALLCETNLIDLVKSSVRGSNIYLRGNVVTGTFLPILLTDSDLYIDTLCVDLRDTTSGTARIFTLLDGLSSVRVDRLVVLAGGASWGVADFGTFNGTVEIGRIECDSLPVSSLHANIGASAVWSVGDVILNQRSRVNGTAALTNADVTLNGLAFGKQILTNALSATRTVTEPTVGLYPGREIYYARQASSTGAFAMVIGAGGDNLTAPGTWVRRMWNGTAWTTSGKGTFSNAPRIGTIASASSPVINTDFYDQFNLTAMSASVASMTTNLSGTPVDGQKLTVRFKDNGTARTISWGASFTGTLLSTTVISKTHLQHLTYDAAAAKWVGTYADSTGY